MRRADWHARMQAAINTASVVPFNYGQHDCALFSAYVVDQMCDTDHFERLRKTFVYQDEAQASQVIESGGGLYTMAVKWLGEPIRVAFAMPGDVALVRNNGSVLLGIVEGHQIVAAGEKGVVPLPLENAVCAWSIK